MPLSTQSINGYRRIVGENLTNCWGVTCDGLASHPGGVEILLAASCYGNRDKLRPDEPVGSKGFTSLIVLIGVVFLVFSHIVRNIGKKVGKALRSADACLNILNNSRVRMQHISTKSNQNYNLALTRTCSVFFRSFLTTGFSKYPFECLSF